MTVPSMHAAEALLYTRSECCYYCMQLCGSTHISWCIAIDTALPLCPSLTSMLQSCWVLLLYCKRCAQALLFACKVASVIALPESCHNKDWRQPIACAQNLAAKGYSMPHAKTSLCDWLVSYSFYLRLPNPYTHLHF